MFGVSNVVVREVETVFSFLSCFGVVDIKNKGAKIAKTVKLPFRQIRESVRGPFTSFVQLYPEPKTNFEDISIIGCFDCLSTKPYLDCFPNVYITVILCSKDVFGLQGKHKMFFRFFLKLFKNSEVALFHYIETTRYMLNQRGSNSCIISV
jgi:hypothetical protein